MKPQFERVTYPHGCSLRVYNRRVPEIPFEWHHHPEYELTLTLNSRGWRFVGDHIGRYQAPDLVLVPPDMPHTWASTETFKQDEPHTAIVIWFSHRWAFQLAELCPEYSAVRRLLQNASTGLAFTPETATQMAGQLPLLLSEVPRTRLHAALDLLVLHCRGANNPPFQKCYNCCSFYGGRAHPAYACAQSSSQTISATCFRAWTVQGGEYLRAIAAPALCKAHWRKRERVSLQAAYRTCLYAPGGD